MMRLARRLGRCKPITGRTTAIACVVAIGGLTVAGVALGAPPSDLPTCPPGWAVEVVAETPRLQHPTAVACAPDPAAWRLYSRRLDRELWVARDAEAATALDADGARAELPVVLADDLERLRDFDDHRLKHCLDVLMHFPGARLAELDPEAAS